MTERAAQIIDRVTHSASEAMVRLRVKSALNPLLWLCGLISIPAMIAALFTSGGLQVFLAVLTALPPAAACVAYAYLLYKDPDKLQSEEYQIQKRVLDIIEEKGGTVPILATSLEAIANPMMRRLGRSDEGAES